VKKVECIAEEVCINPSLWKLDT